MGWEHAISSGLQSFPYITLYMADICRDTERCLNEAEDPRTENGITHLLPRSYSGP